MIIQTHSWLSEQQQCQKLLLVQCHVVVCRLPPNPQNFAMYVWSESCIHSNNCQTTQTIIIVCIVKKGIVPFIKSSVFVCILGYFLVSFQRHFLTPVEVYFHLRHVHINMYHISATYVAWSLSKWCHHVNQNLFFKCLHIMLVLKSTFCMGSDINHCKYKQIHWASSFWLSLGIL